MTDDKEPPEHKFGRVGLCAGAFDLLHPGHLDHLRQAKGRCDFLVVGLHTDPMIDRPFKNKPIQTTHERYLQLIACKFIDGIVPYDTEHDLKNIMLVHDIDIRFVGADHAVDDLHFEFCDLHNITTVYLERLHDWSTSELRERIIWAEHNREKA